MDKSIDFLLDKASPVINYRLRKEILNDLSKTEEENMLEQIYQTPLFKMLLDNIKPNGFTYFLTRGLENVQTENRLHMLTYNIKRVLNIFDTLKLVRLLKELATKKQEETIVISLFLSIYCCFLYL